MEASPDALAPGSSTSVAIRATKDIAFGSVSCRVLAILDTN